jgi:MFS family permease
MFWAHSFPSTLTGLIFLVQADYLGRRYGIGIACILTTIATFVQAFAPRGNLGAFMAGRVIIGFGIGMAISKFD